MIKSENLGQNAQNQRLFLIIAAPTKLVKYKIPVSKELSPHRACTKGETAPYDTPPYEHAAGVFPRGMRIRESMASSAMPCGILETTWPKPMLARRGRGFHEGGDSSL